MLDSTSSRDAMPTERAGRQRSQQFLFRREMIEPVQVRPASDYRHLPIVAGLDIGIGGRGEDCIGFGPAVRCRRQIPAK